MIAGPKWRLGHPEKNIGAKNCKIAMGAYSSELITPERKRISERLKRLWNRKRMPYKFYVRPWPLTPGVNTVSAFARTSAKISGFWRFSQNFLRYAPLITFAINSPLYKCWKFCEREPINADERYDWKFGIFAISVKIAHSTSRNSENRKNIEKRKQTGQSTMSRLHYC